MDGFFDVINGLGLPGWFIIIACSLWILKIVGFLDPLVLVIQEKIQAGIASERTEQIATFRQMTEFQSNLIGINNQFSEFLIDTISEKIGRLEDNDAKIIDGQFKILDGQKQQEYWNKDQATKMTILVGLWEEDFNKRRILDDDKNTQILHRDREQP